MFTIKLIFLSVRRDSIFGCLSGSLILYTNSTFLIPDFLKYSAVCSVANILKPNADISETIGSNFSLFLVPPIVINAAPVSR